jgi:hypothetical protein
MAVTEEKKAPTQSVDAMTEKRSHYHAVTATHLRSSCHSAARCGIFSSRQEHMAVTEEKMAPTQSVDAMTAG